MPDVLYVDLGLMTPDEALKYARKGREAMEAVLAAPESAQLVGLETMIAMIIRQSWIAGGVAAVQALDQQGVYVEVRGLDPESADWPDVSGWVDEGGDDGDPG